MKVNKNLSTAIVLSLMLGVYGTASAANVNLIGVDGEPGTVTINDSKDTPVSIVTTSGTINNEMGESYKSHSFTVSAGEWKDVYGSLIINPLVYDSQKAEFNSVTLNGTASANTVMGGYMERQNVIVQSNTVTISGTQVSVSGAESGKPGTIVGGGALGAATEPATVKINKVIIDNASVDADVYGGSIDAVGNAEFNEVTLQNNTAVGGYVVGGKTETGTAKSNTVKVIDNSGGGISRSVDIYGGQVKVSGDAIENKVTISNCSAINQVTGGYSLSGNANKNVVELTVATINGTSRGGRADNGTANENTIRVYRCTTNDSVTGGNSVNSTADGNYALITNSNIKGNVFGAWSKSGAQNNIVSVGESVISHEVTGGYVSDGIAKNNSVTISDSATVKESVYGGRVYNKGTAEANKVSVGSNVDVDKNVYGGYVSDGIAKSNTVTISSGTVSGFVFGGRSISGDAAKNTVTLSNGNVGFDVFGGVTGSGNATENTVTLSGGTVAGRVYGGSSEQSDAKDNNVSVANVTIGKDGHGGIVFGGHTEEGEASGNSVTIESGTIGTIDTSMGMFGEFSGAIGGSSGDGTVKNNTVTINGGTIGLGISDETSGGISQGCVAGGESMDGDAANNKVTVNAGTINKEVIGGHSWDGNAASNEVTINGGTFAKRIFGGESSSGNADSNTVNIKGGTFKGAIYGGASFFETANNNIVNISGDANTSAADVYGGQGASWGEGNTLNIDKWSGKAMNSINAFQTINIKDTKEIKVGNVDGLENNGVVLKVNYKDLDTEMAGLKVGGEIVFLEKTGTGDDLNSKFASGKLNDKYEVGQGVWNTKTEGFGVEASKVEFKINETKAFVTLAENILTGNLVDDGLTEDLVLNTKAADYDKIYGAYSEKGTATAATVNVDVKGADLSKSTIYGNNVSADGNTLNVKANGVNVGGIENFESMNFYIPQEAAAGDKLLTVGSDVDLSNVKVAAGFHNDTALTYGDKVILIKAPSVTGMDGVSEVKVDDTDFTEYDVMVYQGDAGMNQIESGATTLVAEMANMDLKDNSKILSETTIAGATIINNGSDMLAGAGLDSAASAIASDIANGAPSGSMSMFGAVSGNKSKVKSGSHIDVTGWNMNLGFAKELKNKDGKLILGPVVEYGRGNYDSYLDNGYHGEGNAHFVGGGVIAKQINDNGNYFEGSLRAGKLTKEFKSSGGRYDSDVTYFAGHVGLGHIQKMDAKNSMDYYAKYFHTHTASDDIAVNAKGKDLDMHAKSLTSARLRVGTRLNHKMSEKSSYYIGFAWQREFSGIANASLAGKEIAAPSIKGQTGMMELGFKMFDSNRYDLDLGGFGSVGKKKGAGVNLNFNLKF